MWFSDLFYFFASSPPCLLLSPFMVATDIRLLGVDGKTTSWTMFSLRRMNQLRGFPCAHPQPPQSLVKYHCLPSGSRNSQLFQISRPRILNSVPLLFCFINWLLLSLGYLFLVLSCQTQPIIPPNTKVLFFTPSDSTTSLLGKWSACLVIRSNSLLEYFAMTYQGSSSFQL